ncbi:MAG TPA: hypothetical protein VF746_29945 [Longimicrobium sp.]|jgi:hypothetical protein
MRTLTLDLDALAVEAFETTPAALDAAPAVPSLPLRTCDETSLPSCGIHCQTLGVC